MSAEDDGVVYDDVERDICDNFMWTLKRLDITNRVVCSWQARDLYLWHTDKKQLEKVREFEKQDWEQF